MYCIYRLCEEEGQGCPVHCDVEFNEVECDGDGETAVRYVGDGQVTDNGLDDTSVTVSSIYDSMELVDEVYEVRGRHWGLCMPLFIALGRMFTIGNGFIIEYWNIYNWIYWNI